MSVRELSKITGISPSHILRIESGEYDFTVTKFLVLAEVLCLPIASVLEPILFATRRPAEIGRSAQEDKEFKTLEGHEEDSALELLRIMVRVVVSMHVSSNPKALVDAIEIPFKEAKDRLTKYAAKFDTDADNVERIFFIHALAGRPYSKLHDLGLIDAEMVKSYLAWAKANTFCSDDLKYKSTSNSPRAQWLSGKSGFNASKDNPSQKQAGLDMRNRLDDDALVKAKVESLPELLDEVRKKVSKRGQKSALAVKLGVSRQAVDQWLSGDSKPSAELTFELLNWVKQPERQK